MIDAGDLHRAIDMVENLVQRSERIGMTAQPACVEGIAFNIVHGPAKTFFFFSAGRVTRLAVVVCGFIEKGRPVIDHDDAAILADLRRQLIRQIPFPVRREMPHG